MSMPQEMVKVNPLALLAAIQTAAGLLPRYPKRRLRIGSERRMKRKGAAKSPLDQEV